MKLFACYNDGMINLLGMCVPPNKQLKFAGKCLSRSIHRLLCFKVMIHCFERCFIFQKNILK